MAEIEQRQNRMRLSLVCCAVAAISSAASSASAATFVVTKTAASGAGTLSAAISAANLNTGPDTIVFAPGVAGTIKLAAGVSAKDDLVIEGPGASQLTVSAAGGEHILEGDPSGRPPGAPPISLAVRGLRFAKGKPAIRVTRTKLLVEDSVFEDNLLRSGHLLDENSAIYLMEAGSDVVIRRSTFRRNQSAVGGTGAILVEDSTFEDNTVSPTAIKGHGDVTIRRSRFKSTGHTQIGAIEGLLIESSLIEHSDVGGSFPVIEFGFLDDVVVGRIVNSTITGTFERAIRQDAGSLSLEHVTIHSSAAGTQPLVWMKSGTLDVRNSLLEDAKLGVPALQRSSTSQSAMTINAEHSIFFDDGTGHVNGTNIGNLQPIGVQVEPLADNGGPTWTHALKANSVALDAAKSSQLTLDQRGQPRSRGPAADIGAVEMDFCGNGSLDGKESCDDANTAPGSGCSATCVTEPGWTCTGSPSVCTVAPSPVPADAGDAGAADAAAFEASTDDAAAVDPVDGGEAGAENADGSTASGDASSLADANGAVSSPEPQAPSGGEPASAVAAVGGGDADGCSIAATGSRGAAGALVAIALLLLSRRARRLGTKRS